MAVASSKKSEFPGMKATNWGVKSLERAAAMQAHFSLNGAKPSRQQRKAFRKAGK